MNTLKIDSDQLSTLAEVLLGAAYADADYDGREAEVITSILSELVKDGRLPDEVEMKLTSFNEDSFDVEGACGTLNFNAKQRHAVFGLLARVVEADDVHDLSESMYITRVAKALGAKPEEYSEYVVEFIEVTPPPLPN